MKLVTLIIALAFLPVFANAQTIKLNLAKDTKYEVCTTTKVSSVATLMGQEMATNIDNNTVETIQVKEKRAGETDLVSTISKITMNMEGMGQTTTYDSDKADNTGVGTDMLDKMKGRVKNITVDAGGKIIRQDNTEEIAGASMLGISNEAVSFIQNIFIGREIKAGVTWYDSATIAADKLTTFTAGTYTIQAVNAATVTITFKGTQTSSGTMEQMGMEMATTSSSKVTSQFEIEIATGLIKQSTQTTDGTMNIEAGGMSIPASTKTTVTMTTKQL
jgi:Family of unknown function (DUF6263)